MKKTWKILAVALALVMICGLFAGCGGSGTTTPAPATPTPDTGSTTPADTGSTDSTPADTGSTDAAPADTGSSADDGQLPRNETLYFGGQQWGVVNSWNPIGTNQNNGMGTTAQPQGSRTLMFETPYMYDFMTGRLLPLLADGDYEWNADQTQLTYTIKSAAKWSDGTPVTANDVKRTWDVSAEILNPAGATYGAFIDSIDADGQKVTINLAVDENGTPINPLIVLDYLSGVFVVQAAWIDTVYERNNGDAMSIQNDPADDVVWSGPYTKYFDDDQKVVLIRDDNYWGQDASMWGTLPVPKYIAHALYADNAATETAFKAGQIDVDQQFLPNIQNLWLNDGLEVSTYYETAPYGVCLGIPTAWYNMNLPVIAENTALRKAIAMAVDYDTIIANAMTNQSPSFSDVPRSMMNPTDGEQALFDHDAIKDLQWVGKQYDEANALLDEAGLLDTDGDGWREYNGEKIQLNACCPNGWTDWQAAMQMVAAAGENIGVEILTEYPEYSIYQTVFTDPAQTQYAIFMWSPPAASPSNPYARVRAFLSSDYIGIQNNWSGNWGQYVNEEATALINQIPTTTDQAKLVELYTQLNEIYLTEVPSFGLMYRPAVFHAVNETVWTNFPSGDDGRGIPPADCTDGYGIRALYELELVG